MFTVTRLQAATYLLCVCLFSISFLVFLNSSISFVITDLIQQTDQVGNAVGTLGFADELLALIACPCWGLISDRIGVRAVCVLGYAIIGLALLFLVQSHNVYPDLLLARLLFSLGGSATTTMVSAILPSMVAPQKDYGLMSEESVASNYNSVSPPSISESTHERLSQRQQGKQSSNMLKQPSTARLAGLVGLFTGSGALLALGVFLPLPAFFQRSGLEPDKALIDSFYIVGVTSIVVSLCCFLGLRNLHGEERESWFRNAMMAKTNHSYMKILCDQALSSMSTMLEAFTLGIKEPQLGLGYMGGFVARASSVGISLFIPLFVNAYFIGSGLCDKTTHDPQSMKKNCPDGFILAAKLTGVSQLVALLSAPIFGYAADKFRHRNIPLLIAALLGILGYVAIIILKSPDIDGEKGNHWILVIAAMLGLSQIGAIVCSLGLIGRSVLVFQEALKHEAAEASANEEDERSRLNEAYGRPPDGDSSHAENEIIESRRLLQDSKRVIQTYKSYKGSIAGVYSLWGACGILLLTKFGGKIFDDFSSVAPFYLLVGFNALLLIYGITCEILITVNK